MACVSQAMVSANMLTVRMFDFGKMGFYKPISSNFTVRASSVDDPDCNDAECAPDKEVGKISMEWVAEEKTKVVGTFPPRNRRPFTGYVEKDTAGQTNIYSVEPAVYVAENAISSGTAGSSSDGSENTLAISFGVALICIAGASSILLQVNKKSPPVVRTTEYNGPSLSYYISKFKPSEIVPSQTETPPPVLEETTAPSLVGPESLQTENQPELSISSDS